MAPPLLAVHEAPDARARGQIGRPQSAGVNCDPRISILAAGAGMLYTVISMARLKESADRIAANAGHGIRFHFQTTPPPYE
jgi:hypothetical protein